MIFIPKLALGNNLCRFDAQSFQDWYDQGKFIPIQFDKQIVPGTFKYTLSYLVDNEIDLSVFEQRYKNDPPSPRGFGATSATDAPAYDPAILPIVLFAYSRGTSLSVIMLRVFIRQNRTIKPSVGGLIVQHCPIILFRMQ